MPTFYGMHSFNFSKRSEWNIVGGEGPGRFEMGDGVFRLADGGVDGAGGHLACFCLD